MLDSLDGLLEVEVGDSMLEVEVGDLVEVALEVDLADVLLEVDFLVEVRLVNDLNPVNVLE